MRFDAILFDLDGTLTESADGILNTVVHSLRETGRPIPDAAALRTFIGPPLITSYNRVCGIPIGPEMDEVIDIYHERFSDIGWKENRVYPGITPMLRELKREGVYMAVASAKPLPFVRKILRYFEIDRYFDKVCAVGMENTSESKTDILLSALPEGIDRSRIAMIGDRMYDLDAARELSLVPVGAGYGYGSREELLEHGAVYVAEDVRELTMYLLGYMPEGRFISFEGTDGCGKSTQMEKTAQFLSDRGFEVQVTREPGGTSVGEKIRELLLSNSTGDMTGECEAYLFAASRAEHVRKVIRPALKESKILLCDRFIDSSVAYQGAGRELGTEKIRLINQEAVDGTLPCLTFFFCADPQRTRERIKDPDRIESEDISFTERVTQAYLDEAEKSCGRVVVTNADRGIDEIFEDVKQKLTERLF